MSTGRREADSAYAWWRLVATLGLMTVGSSAMYVVAVVLPAVQAEFAVGRSEASVPYTLLMIGHKLVSIWREFRVTERCSDCEIKDV